MLSFDPWRLGCEDAGAKRIQKYIEPRGRSKRAVRGQRWASCLAGEALNPVALPSGSANQISTNPTPTANPASTTCPCIAPAAPTTTISPTPTPSAINLPLVISTTRPPQSPSSSSRQNPPKTANPQHMDQRRWTTPRTLLVHLLLSICISSPKPPIPTKQVEDCQPRAHLGNVPLGNLPTP